MQTSFVYILLCADNTYYTGVTENVYKRFDDIRTENTSVLIPSQDVR
jgi:predicted GIY-YIG superfamily endonuclease